MPLLEFITDSDLEKAVKTVLISANNFSNPLDMKKFNKNIIDPFAALFEMGGFEINEETWLTNERMRQAQKTLSNAVGEFHQNILGSINGWQSLGKGRIVDVVSHEHKIIAEVKNKHNTVKGKDKKAVYSDLESLIVKQEFYNYTGYYVVVIPKSKQRFNRPFTPSDNVNKGKMPINELIREIDGFSFYELVTGVDKALYKLFKAIPIVIDSIKKDSGYTISDSILLERFFFDDKGQPR